MAIRKPIIAAVAVMLTAYAVWPYVTLYRLAEAIRHGDANTLETLVDWDGVREGIKEDICDTVFDQPQVKTANADATLPPFGYSFVRGIAANAIDEQINAEALVSAAQAAADGTPASKPATEANPSIAWAFFDTPTVFSVMLRQPGAAAKDAPIRLQLELHRGSWKVTRAWLPPEMLVQANSRT